MVFKERFYTCSAGIVGAVKNKFLDFEVKKSVKEKQKKQTNKGLPFYAAGGT